MKVHRTSIPFVADFFSFCEDLNIGEDDKVKFAARKLKAVI